MIEFSARVARLPQLSPSTHGGGTDAHSLCAAEISKAASLSDGHGCENADTTADRKVRGETGQRRKLIHPYIPRRSSKAERGLREDQRQFDYIRSFAPSPILPLSALGAKETARFDLYARSSAPLPIILRDGTSAQHV